MLKKRSKNLSLKNWGFVSLGMFLVIGLSAYFFVENQLSHVRGSHTQAVDRTQFSISSAPLVIVNVSVLSPNGKAMIDGQTVFLEHGLISYVRPNGDAPKDIRTIDGTGKYLIPGLIDSHVHLNDSPNDLLLYIANGVTHIRDSGGTNRMLDMREATKNGAIGPDMHISSEKVSSNHGISARFEEWTRTRNNIWTAKEAETLAAKLKTDGYDSIKMSSFISPSMYREILTAAKNNEIDVVGHIPREITLDDLYISGQIEIAHIEEVVKLLNAEFGGYNFDTAGEYLDFVRLRAPEVAKALKERDIAVTSTVWYIENIPKQKFAPMKMLRSIPLRYANPGAVEGTYLTKGWLPSSSKFGLSEDTAADPEKIIRSQVFWETYVNALHIVGKEMVAQSVIIMAGTDATGPASVAGFSIHEELQALSRIDMTPSQIIASVTAIPGDWLNANSGRIIPGYQADLVLLEGDPLKDIANTKRISAVILDGKFLDRIDLDAMLLAVENANSDARKFDLSAYE